MLKKSTLEKIISEDLSEIWSILSQKEKKIITDNFEVQNFRKNQIIYQEGDEPECLWILLKGKVKLYKDGACGRQQILRLYRPIQYFGYRAYFASESYLSTAVAFETSVIGSIKMDVVSSLIDGNMKLAWFFIKELSRDLGGSDTKIVNLTQKHLRGRLAESIIMLIENYGFEEDGETLQIYMSRDDIASLSNMTTSNAIRTLSNFVSERLITVDGRRIKIINQAQLLKISKFG